MVSNQESTPNIIEAYQPKLIPIFVPLSHIVGQLIIIGVATVSSLALKLRRTT